MRPVMRPVMRTATTIEGSAGKETAEFAVEAEKLGLDVCWVAEAWGADAPSVLGYLAARTGSMLLGSGVIQVGTRSPVTIAQTAMTLAHLSGGRFLLGLGVSGPQVIEGLHGIPFGHPLARMRETVAIVRSVFTGEKVSFAGSQYRIPLGTRPMRVSLPPVSVPVYLASLSPRMLELTGEIADGWLGTSFVPEGASAYFTHLDAGLARPAAGGLTWTSARAPRSTWSTGPTWPRPWPAGRRNWPSRSAAWARPPATSTTTPTAARAGRRSPPGSASAGRPGIATARRAWSPTRWSWRPR